VTDPKTIWIASIDDKNWDNGAEYDTHEDAINMSPAALGLRPGEVYHVGRKLPPMVPSVDAWEILQVVQDTVYERVGDVVGDWLEEATHSQVLHLQDQLDAVFHDWLRTYEHYPEWYTVTDIEPHICPEVPRLLS